MVGRALEGRPTAQRHQRSPAGRLPAISAGGQDLPHQASAAAVLRGRFAPLSRSRMIRVTATTT
jgi:hypothetical protein